MSQELEERFLRFALSVRDFCRKIKWDIINTEYIRQVIRSSSSIAANYVEASDPLGKADEKLKIKTARREAKETYQFLSLLITNENELLEKERMLLLDEVTQIRKILSAIILKL